MLQNPSKSRSVMVCLEHLGEHVYFYHAWCPKIPIRSTETTAGYDPQASCLYFTQLGNSAIHQIYGHSARSLFLATGGQQHCAPV